jgi:amidophosphoribosyltransferase
MLARDAREKCGLFGVFGRPDAVQLTYYGLHALQHRGQESAGIAAWDGTRITCHTGMGLVGEVFRPDVLRNLPGVSAIGHVRYSTTGSSRIENAQPILRSYARGQVAVAHNGNLVNAQLLRDEYEAHGHIFTSTTDTEVILHLLAKPSHQVKSDPLSHVLNHIQGSFSLLFLFEDALVAARDAVGNRPLALGRLPDGAYCVSSESCAFDIIGAEHVREVEPGEILTVDAQGLTSRYYLPREEVRPAHCVFEHVYFARQNSVLFGDNVHMVRRRLGAALAREGAVPADAVVPVPDSGSSAALGYSEESGIPLELGFVRSHYLGRTFLHPDQKQRDLGVKLKLSVVQQAIQGKRLVVVDDSVVRGTTTRGKIRELRAHGAREIHLRVSCPPIRHPCYYGIDFPTRGELLANERSIEDIRRYLEVDSVVYLSLERMLACLSRPPTHYCTACWSGKYPIPVDYQVNKFSMERDQGRLFV